MSVVTSVKKASQGAIFFNKARFKRLILHAPNRIAKLNACKMRRLNQLNATYFNSMRVSRIFD